MAELASSSAFGLAHRPGDHGVVPPTGLAVRERTDIALATVIARRSREADLAARVAEAFGLELPATSQRRASGPIAFVWAGPGHWLAVCDGELGHRFEARLRGAIDGLAAISDQSDGRAVIRIHGARARDMLAKGLPVDTDPSVMQAGCAVVSAVGHIGVHLWQLDDTPTYDCAVSRCYASSFLHWIDIASAEYRLPAADS